MVHPFSPPAALRPHSDPARTPVRAPVRALSSLTRHDVDAVRATVRAAGGGFTIEEHDDYDGYRSLLIAPEGAAAGRCYSVSGRTGQVELAIVDGDDLTCLGAFASVGAAMLALRPVLEAGAAPVASARTAAARALALLDGHGVDAGVHAAMQADAAAFWAPLTRAVDVLGRLDEP